MSQGRHRVVIVGGGFGGIRATRALARTDVDITIVDRTNHHLFQPLLYQVATGILPDGLIAPALRSVVSKQANTRVVLADVQHLDLDGRVVHALAPDGQKLLLSYDSLVVAAGCTDAYFGHDEWAVFAPGLKTLADAGHLRSHILGAFELAELATDPAERAAYLTFAVIGAGPTGVEVAGQIAELAHETLPREYKSVATTDAKILLIEAGPQVLAAFAPKLQRYTQRRLQRMGVEVWLNTMARDMDSGSQERNSTVRVPGQGQHGHYRPPVRRHRRVRDEVHRRDRLHDVGIRSRALPGRVGKPDCRRSQLGAGADLQQEPPSSDHHLRTRAERARPAPLSAGIDGFDRGAAREDLIVPGACPGNRGRQMNASLLAVLNDAERLLVAQTERAELAALDEDAAIDLEARIRRARNKYVGQYRRAASARVAEHSGRGTARPENKRAAMKAEAFEEALARVSRRVATLARQAAAALRAERLAAARAARQGHAPGTRPAEPAAARQGPSVTGEPTGDRALRSPRTEKQRAGTLASGARRQAKRDSR